MKKLYTAIFAVSLSLLLSACGTSGNSATNTSDSVKLTSDQEKSLSRNTDAQSDATTTPSNQAGQSEDWALDEVPYSSESVQKLAQSATQDKQAGTGTYYGNWEVKKNLKTGSVSAYSEKEIRKVLGAKVNYTTNSASFNTIVCSNPRFEKTEVPEDVFLRDMRVSFKSLGIKSKSVTMINVFTNKNEFWSDSPAGQFIVKDKDTLILVDQGEYFELGRVQ